MADIADLFGRPSVEDNYALATTVKEARNPGSSVLEAFDLSRFSLDSPVFFLTYKKTTDPEDPEKVIISHQTSWKALVNGDNNTLTNLVLAPGYTDIGNDVGDFIECIPTSFWGNSLMDGLGTSLNPDGTLKLNQAMVQLINDATVPLATRREYFGTQATFDDDPARFGWLFMVKDQAYAKADFQRLYDHLVAVDAASVKDHASTTFKFADKFFGTVPVSLDASQTEFNTLGKSAGNKTHSHVLSNSGHAKMAPVGNEQRVARIGVPSWTTNHLQTVSSAANSTANALHGIGLGGATNSADGLPPYQVTNFIVKT